MNKWELSEYNCFSLISTFIMSSTFLYSEKMHGLKITNLPKLRTTLKYDNRFIIDKNILSLVPIVNLHL